MTLSQLAHTLPNALHDARLFGISISFIAGTAVLDFAIDVSTDEMDGYFEDAEIRLSGLRAIVLDAPGVMGPMLNALHVRDTETDAQCYPAYLSVSEHLRYMYYSLHLAHPCNTYMHIAAESAEIEWKKDSRREGSAR